MYRNIWIYKCIMLWCINEMELCTESSFKPGLLIWACKFLCLRISTHLGQRPSYCVQLLVFPFYQGCLFKNVHFNMYYAHFKSIHTVTRVTRGCLTHVENTAGCSFLQFCQLHKTVIGRKGHLYTLWQDIYVFLVPIGALLLDLCATGWYIVHSLETKGQCMNIVFILFLAELFCDDRWACESVQTKPRDLKQNASHCRISFFTCWVK